MESNTKKIAKISTFLTVLSASFIVGFIAPAIAEIAAPVEKIESAAPAFLSLSGFEPFLQVPELATEKMRTYETESVIATEAPVLTDAAPPVVEEAPPVEEEPEKLDIGGHTLPGEPVSALPIHLDVVGLPVDEATSLLGSEGTGWMIGSIDGAPQIMPGNGAPGRQTLTVENGIVVSVSIESWDCCSLDHGFLFRPLGSDGNE